VSQSPRLRVDPVACDGVGICGHAAGGLIRFDSWGFPIVPDVPLDPARLDAARAAIAACPRRALFLDDA
jgi:ferredoxin